MQVATRDGLQGRLAEQLVYPSAMNRFCQRQTIGFAAPVLVMTAIVPSPPSVSH